MTNITGRRTINTIKIYEIDTDPTSGGGAVAPIGTIASVTDGSGVYFKATSSNTGWAQVLTSASGANTALSNLSSTAVNTSLIPASNDGYSIGSASLVFHDGYYHNIFIQNKVGIGTTNATKAALDVRGDGYFSSNLEVDGYFFGYSIKPLIYTSNHTLNNSDNGCTLLINSSSTVTITVPTGLIGGFGCVLIQQGTGQIATTTSGGATLSNRQSNAHSAGQFAVISVSSIGSNNYVLAGDTTT